ncbi:hypothetical protein [Ralstonia pseudosolanacearum]|uniref:hypothetical protein n=2 Tax=Ralstonia pseudosolanacearum TaxID=1310165 RepID=UPI0008F856E8|nr:hypothetical protein [Ralstonia pseudosolanacearum]NKA08806.1 hypothetical protein [Ralstonia solanacearum]QWF59902.1 hypothetical protein KM864_11840 [Ralstonia solanacearum]TXD91390.1 hypothetical protein FUT89_12065 [Ralstonia pseudosolanacearum]BCM02930.1 hypothetical protein MAFF301560_23170 [Ralstonia solanacearum]BEU46318.1 hypothetical protein MAFF211519_16430 [Ralstonia pseudosolanacearum]
MRKNVSVAMARKYLFAVLALLAATTAHADCVVGASLATTFRVLDSHTIVLYSGSTPKILIKTFSFFYASSSVTVLKDSFCDYASAVLYVDGQAVDAQQVKHLN